MNPNVALTLDDAVAEVLGLTTGLDLQYRSDMDRYRAIVRQLNRALRNNALEKDWSCYSSNQQIDRVSTGMREITLRRSVRLRIVGDDAIQFRNRKGDTVHWAYILPRESIHKYSSREGLWASVEGNRITFSRNLPMDMEGLEIWAPVVREPRMFEIPLQTEDPDEHPPEFPLEVRNTPLDFDYPDVIVLRAAYQYAQTDPLMQPRVQTIEAQYKNLMYQLLERDTRSTDSPYLNEFQVPMQGSIHASKSVFHHRHPHSDERLY